MLHPTRCEKMFCAVKIKKKSFSKSKITYIVRWAGPNSPPHGSRHSRHNVYPQRLMGCVLTVQRVRAWTLEIKFFSSDGNPDKKPDPESKRYWRGKIAARRADQTHTKLWPYAFMNTLQGSWRRFMSLFWPHFLFF